MKKNPTNGKDIIEELARYPHQWNAIWETSLWGQSINKIVDGLVVLSGKLDNFCRDMMKMNQTVHTI